MSDNVHVIWLTRQPTLAVRVTCVADELPGRIGSALNEVGGYLQDRKASADVEGIYTRFLRMEPDYDLEVGYTLHHDIPGRGKIVRSELPDCEAAIVNVTGTPRGLIEDASPIREWMAEHRREPGGAPWEVHRWDPEQDEDEQTPSKTVVYWPLKPGQ